MSGVKDNALKCIHRKVDLQERRENYLQFMLKSIYGENAVSRIFPNFQKVSKGEDGGDFRKSCVIQEQLKSIGCKNHTECSRFLGDIDMGTAA